MAVGLEIGTVLTKVPALSELEIVPSGEGLPKRRLHSPGVQLQQSRKKLRMNLPEGKFETAGVGQKFFHTEKRVV